MGNLFISIQLAGGAASIVLKDPQGHRSLAPQPVKLGTPYVILAQVQITLSSDRLDFSVGQFHVRFWSITSLVPHGFHLGDALVPFIQPTMAPTTVEAVLPTPLTVRPGLLGIGAAIYGASSTNPLVLGDISINPGLPCSQHSVAPVALPMPSATSKACSAIRQLRTVQPG